MKIYDISQKIFSCAVYPGDPAPERKPLVRMEDGACYNLTAFSMCAHNGTHADAPFHFIEGGKTIDRLPVETFVGRAFVAECDGFLRGGDVEALLARARRVGDGCERRMLLRGDVEIGEEAADAFARAGLLLLGTESQTVGPMDAPMAVHRVLLGGGVVILEGLRLGGVAEGSYLLSAAPLNLEGSDGAPCRAVLMETPTD